MRPRSGAAIGLLPLLGVLGMACDPDAGGGGNPDAGASAAPDARPAEDPDASAADDPDAAPIDPVSCAERPGRFDLADVSFLFPLPATPSEASGLLDLDAAGSRGALLPVALFDQLPAPLSSFGEVTRADLRVVAARVDPCFQADAGGECHRQLRLVVQPIVPGSMPVRAADAAVHLFYDLDDAELDALVDALDELRALADGRTGCRPLGVHPVMAAEGLAGPYAARLRQAILDSAGADNLVRAAAMQLQQPGSVWRFSSFDISGGELAPLVVPRLTGEVVQLFSLSDTRTSAGELQPPPAPSRVPLLLTPEQVVAATAAELAAASAETFAIENPRREDTRSVDCVSCHISRRALDAARLVRPFEIADDDAYAGSGHDLALGVEPVGLGSQRAFGYLGSLPSITPRVIHESAEAADALSAR